MSTISMKSLLEAGVHFGHQTKRWNPKMAKYIFGARNNIHIIDLQKTVKELKKAYNYVRDSVAQGTTILFVGTKKQAQESIQSEAIRCGAFYVRERWLGGTLTNFDTIKKSIARLRELERMDTSGVMASLSKKEASRLKKEQNKMEKSFAGIKVMDGLPGMIFVVDPVQEATAVAEARKLEIPVVSICDTNCDPDQIDYPIPGNDDAIRAVKLFCAIVADAVLEGKQMAQKQASGESSPDLSPEFGSEKEIALGAPVEAAAQPVEAAKSGPGSDPSGEIL